MSFPFASHIPIQKRTPDETSFFLNHLLNPHPHSHCLLLAPKNAKHKQTKHPHHHHRRPRLRRPLRSTKPRKRHQHTQHRLNRQTRHALHTKLCLRARLLTLKNGFQHRPTPSRLRTAKMEIRKPTQKRKNIRTTPTRRRIRHSQNWQK